MTFKSSDFDSLERQIYVEWTTHNFLQTKKYHVVTKLINITIQVPEDLGRFKATRCCAATAASKDETPNKVIWIIVYLLTVSQDEAVKNEKKTSM